MCSFCKLINDRQPPGSGLLSITDSIDAAASVATTNAVGTMAKTANTREKSIGGVGHARLSNQACVDGSAGGFPCNAVDLLSWVETSTFDDTLEVNDLWGWSYEGREFAVVGLYEGVGYVEITNPTSPVYLGKTDARSSLFRDVKVYNNHAFMVSGASRSGLFVFDLRQLLTVENPPVTFDYAARFATDDDFHNLAINEDSGYAYLLGSFSTCDGGMYMVDVNDPANPTFAGCHDADGYVHDAQCIIYDGPDTAYTGREICFTFNEQVITIMDVTDKRNVKTLSRTGYEFSEWTHQGWLSDDRKYVVFGDELDEDEFDFRTKIRVLDVQSLENPIFLGDWAGQTFATDHNMYTKGDYTYVANYRAGLRVLKHNDLATVDFTEVGFFDTYPDSDSNAGNGAWSVFVDFPSGNVIVSSIEAGLFVLKPQLEQQVVVEEEEEECLDINEYCVDSEECCGGRCRSGKCRRRARLF